MKSQQLLKSYDRGHAFASICPGCKKNLSQTGVTYLIYEFVSCSCKKCSYKHLVEQLWHRSCFIAAAARSRLSGSRSLSLPKPSTTAKGEQT